MLEKRGLHVYPEVLREVTVFRLSICAKGDQPVGNETSCVSRCLPGLVLRAWVPAQPSVVFPCDTCEARLSSFSSWITTEQTKGHRADENGQLLGVLVQLSRCDEREMCGWSEEQTVGAGNLKAANVGVKRPAKPPRCVRPVWHLRGAWTRHVVRAAAMMEWPKVVRRKCEGMTFGIPDVSAQGSPFPLGDNPSDSYTNALELVGTGLLTMERAF